MTHRITFLKVKEEAHRIYDFLRTLGWEKVSLTSSPKSKAADDPSSTLARTRI